MGGDFALAEEVVQEAFAAALEQWPSAGTPAHPRAWLIQTAQHKAIDRLRRSQRFEAPLEDAELLGADANTDPNETPSEHDDYLRLIFTCCHPALAPEAQIALTLIIPGALRNRLTPTNPEVTVAARGRRQQHLESRRDWLQTAA